MMKSRSSKAIFLSLRGQKALVKGLGGKTQEMYFIWYRFFKFA